MTNDLPEIPPLEPPFIPPKPVRPWDLFNANKERVADDLQKERMEICKQCPFFIKTTKQCKKCGCLMELKTRLADATCPIGKWHQAKIGYRD